MPFITNFSITKTHTSLFEAKIRLLIISDLGQNKSIKFHIQPDHQIGDINNYCFAREEAFKKNNAFFNAALYKKIDFYVWSNPEEGKKVLGEEVGFANSDFCIINSKINQTKGHEITHIVCDYGIKPNKRNRFINEGVAVAFDLTNRNRLEMAKSANQENLTIKDLMNEPFKFSDNVIYPIGGAFIEYLMENKEKELIKKLLKEQTYAMLLETYGIETIETFEQKIGNQK